MSVVHEVLGMYWMPDLTEISMSGSLVDVLD